MSTTADGTAGGAPVRADRPESLGTRAAAALDAYRAGRTEPLAELVREATPLLWNIVRSQGVERDDAEDVVQGVWLAFVRNAATIREPEAVLKWLVVSARRAAWDVVRHRREDARLTMTIPDDAGSPAHQLRSTQPTPDAAVLVQERDRTLWTRFLALPDRCQQVLRLVAAADRPDYRAIASLTGMKVTAVGITRGRCLAKLRNLLEDDGTWEGA